MPETSEQREKYISSSQENIDAYLNEHLYKKAFGLLVLVLERLTGEEKAKVIQYYSEKLVEFMF